MDFVQCFPVQLQEVIDLISEKELRLHIPLEELELHFDHTDSGLAHQNVSLDDDDII